jgi:hypothetical protein
MLPLLVVVIMLAAAWPALASCPPPETASDMTRRENVAATGVVSAFVPLGFIFAVDRVYKGDVPAHVLVLGQYRAPDPPGQALFVVLRFHLPGVYSMGSCDGRPLPDPYLGDLGTARAPGADLPVAQSVVGIVIVLAALRLLVRRRPGKPQTPAAASAY